MADERKVFPIEPVLALVAGHKHVQTRDLAEFLLGRTVNDDTLQKAAGPFAAAWLARWYPSFMDLDWQKDANWPEFVARCRGILGDQISLCPLAGRTKALADDVLDALEESRSALARQTAAAAGLEAKVRELKGAETRAESCKAEIDKLEKQVKKQKADMAALQRQVAEFNGKMPVSHDELMQNIKDAIKDGLKGVSIGAAVTGTVEAAAEAEAPQKAEVSEDDFGFNSSSTNNDGFGF